MTILEAAARSTHYASWSRLLQGHSRRKLQTNKWCGRRDESGYLGISRVPEAIKKN